MDELDSLLNKPLLGNIFNTQIILDKINEYGSLEEYCLLYDINKKSLQKILLQKTNIDFLSLVKIAISLEIPVKNLFN